MIVLKVDRNWLHVIDHVVIQDVSDDDTGIDYGSGQVIRQKDTLFINIFRATK